MVYKNKPKDIPKIGSWIELTKVLFLLLFSANGIMYFKNALTT